MGRRGAQPGAPRDVLEEENALARACIPSQSVTSVVPFGYNIVRDKKMRELGELRRINTILIQVQLYHGTSTNLKHYTGQKLKSKTHFYGRAAAEEVLAGCLSALLQRRRAAAERDEHNSAADTTDSSP